MAESWDFARLLLPAGGAYALLLTGLGASGRFYLRPRAPLVAGGRDFTGIDDLAALCAVLDFQAGLRTGGRLLNLPSACGMFRHRDLLRLQHLAATGAAQLTTACLRTARLTGYHPLAGIMAESWDFAGIDNLAALRAVLDFQTGLRAGGRRLDFPSARHMLTWISKTDIDIHCRNFRIPGIVGVVNWGWNRIPKREQPRLRIV